MSLKEKIKSIDSARDNYYTVRGNFSLEATGARLRVELEENIYFLVDEESIGEWVTPAHGNTGFYIPVKKGSAIELNYKGLKHSFTLDVENEKNFLIYETSEGPKVFYPEDVKALPALAGGEDADAVHTNEALPQCYAYVIIYEWHCCRNNKYAGSAVGLWSCSQRYHNRKCC